MAKAARLGALLEEARSGDYDSIIFFKMSRFARNVQEGLHLFEEFGKTDCSVHCIKQKIDTSTPSGKLMTTILLAVAEMESENISEWVSAAALAAVKNGKLHAQPVFWLTRNDDSYVLNEHAETMRRLVDLRLQGYTHTKVSRFLNDEGFIFCTTLLSWPRISAHDPTPQSKPAFRKSPVAKSTYSYSGRDMAG